MFKVDNKDTRTTLFIVLLITYFTPCSSVSIVNFEHVIASQKTVLSGSLTYSLHIVYFFK